MNHLQVATDQSNTIDNCCATIAFLREVMCGGSAGVQFELGSYALYGLGYVYQLLEDKLKEAGDTSLTVVRSLCDHNGSLAKGGGHTKVDA